MPYTAKDAPDYIAKDDAAQWAAIWNSAYAAAIKDGKTEKEAESSAFAQATGVVNKSKREEREPIPAGRSTVVKQEIRFLKELRAADSQGEEMALVGYAAMFNQESRDLGGFRETIVPGAFKRSLASGDDVKALFNHSPNVILGRVKNSTLQLKEDERGLFFRVQLDPDNSDHRNLYASVKRGDIDECSFAFTVNGKDGQAWEVKEGKDAYAARTLKDVNLMDISAVVYPAYTGTAVIARGEDVVPAEIRSALAAHTEHRQEDESYEAEINCVGKAIDKAFPKPNASASDECCFGSQGRFYIIETYDDYVIVSECGSADYYKIPYVEDEAAETYVFGTPEKVVKEYVPADERAAKRVAIFRAEQINAEQRKHQPADDEWMDIADEQDEDDQTRAAKADYKAAKATAKVAYDAAKDDEKDKAKEADKASARAAMAKLRGCMARRSMDTIVESHRKAAAEAAAQAAAHAQTAREHSDAAAAVQKADDERKAAEAARAAEMEECGYNPEDYANPSDYQDNLWTARDNVWTPENDAAGRSAFIQGLEARADGAVLTKKVGGKNLTKDKFAFVGDAANTTTWKYPIHDAGHVRNALARWGQHTGIPAEKEASVYAKIKSAAKGYGIEVAETDAEKATRAAAEAAEYRADRERRLKAAILTPEIRSGDCSCPCGPCKDGDCVNCDCDGCSSEECDCEECNCGE